jgi:flagellar motility protein MotE (MotC chaperone)
VKRIIVTSQVVMMTLLLIKLAFHTMDAQNSPLLSFLPLGHPGQAIAQTYAKTTVPPVRDVSDDVLQGERDLMSLLQKKQKELDARESAIRVEEEKIQALKKDIMQKIDQLTALDNQLTLKLDAENSNDAKRLKDLAKVYEATPPQKAAAMLEKLETKTAAGITINMKRERAGLIWGFLNPQKAVEITREITKKSKYPPE